MRLTHIVASVFLLAGVTTANAQSPAQGQIFDDCRGANWCPRMVVIPAGQFVMGATLAEVAAHNRATTLGEKIAVASELPRIQVRIRRFAVGRYEVTRGQWAACVRAGRCSGSENPSQSDLPITKVSWNDAQEYVRWLRNATGQPYRLLSEAEWEYAAKAGTTTRWSFGEDEKLTGRYAWYVENATDFDNPHPVGRKLPNAFGLYDVHGNVQEWVQDCDSQNLAAHPLDGSPFEVRGCTSRVIRGGGFQEFPEFLRSSSRHRGGVDITWYRWVGLRVARDLP